MVTGYEYLHVMIDDYSRLAYADVVDDLTAACAIAFLRRALAWFAERGVRIQAVMTDNGSCYTAHATEPRCASWACARCGSGRTSRVRTGRPNA